MVQRWQLGSWLDTPVRVAATDQAFPGERLGRPATGPGSVAGWGRRGLGLAVDWVGSLLVANGLLSGLHLAAWGPLAVLLVLNVLLVGTAGFTIGHAVAGLRVERLDGAGPGLVRALVRAVLLCLAVPPLIWDADRRGLHDKAAGTVVVRR